MKNHSLQIIAISGLSSLIACGDSSTKATIKSTAVPPADSAKKTTISVGPNGTGVKTKNTDVQVNGSGVKVRIRDVNVDIKTGK
jgi:hypothetical protein